MKVQLKNVRLAFPVLFEAKTVNGEGEPAFSASFLFGSDHPQVAEIQKAMDAVGKEKWNAKWPAVKKEMELKAKTLIQDGDAKGDYAGFEGQLYVNARNKVRPLVIDRDKTPLIAADGKPYAGCYVNASVELWAQDNKYGKRVNASLRGVQFLKDGDSFSGGGTASEDDFDEIEDGADADDLV